MRDDVGFPLCLENLYWRSPLCATPLWPDRIVPSCMQSYPGDIALPDYRGALQRSPAELAELADTLRAWKEPTRRYLRPLDRLLAGRELSLPGRKLFLDH